MCPAYQNAKHADDAPKLYGPETSLNVKMKPQPTKQQPQNPEALQEYFLSHKISQSLIWNIIIDKHDKYCEFFVS